MLPTAMPAMKSMYSLPSSSISVEPRPRAMASPACTENDCEPGARCCCSRATIARVAGERMVLVIEPAEPGGRAVGARVAADAVELHEVARHVRLQHRLPHAARGQPGQRGADGVGRRGERHVAVLRVVHVGALD